MKGKVFKTTIAAALTASVIGVQAPADVKAAEGDFELTIMHTNDTHANLDKVANRATLVKQIREEKPNNLLLDAGDVFSGTLYFNAFEGEPDMKFMNMMEYDAMTFGNHEFDLGSSEEGHAALDRFAADANFPFLGANVDFSKNEYFKDYAHKEVTAEYIDGNVYNGVIKEIDGEEVGIFGLTTAETAAISSPGDVEFTDYLEAAKKAVADFEAAGVNKIVALTHIGYDDAAAIDNDITLAKEVPGIDVIVGGHTHTKLETPVVAGTEEEPVVIVQANEYNKFLGQLDVTFNEEGIITGSAGKLHDVNAATITPDPDVAAALKPYADEIAALKNQSTGVEAKVALDGSRSVTNGDGKGVRASETNLGNLMTDGMLAKAKTIDPATVIAVQNGGGIRASIDAGDITVGEVLTVMPFGNALAIMDLTGAELKAALEHSVSAYPNESGGFLHVSGLQFKFDPAKAAGSRVHTVNVKVGDTLTPLEDAKRYKVATNTFTAKGGDGYASFGAAYKDGRVSEPGFVDYEMFIDYIETLTEVNPAVEGRITVGAAPVIEEPGEVEMPFTDVFESDWSYGHIYNLYVEKIINGTTPTTFSPKQNLTRWQAVTILSRIFDLEPATAPKSPFKDISRLPKERQQEINAAYDAGLIKGYNATEFKPDAPINRAHFALLVHRLYEASVAEYPVKTFAPYKDLNKLSKEEKEAITALYELEIAIGYDNKFMPFKFTSREETAKMFDIFIDYLVEAEDK